VNATESVVENLHRPGIVRVRRESEICFEGGSRDNAHHWLSAPEQDEGEVAFIGRDLWFWNMGLS
jgi:hypothetical protein